MNVRIVSGQYGGRKLDAPDNSRTHPMGERIRNALFNSLGTEVRHAFVLDAFAGTGVVGLEALSRGARYVTFVERDHVAQKIIEKNIATIGVKTTTSVVKTTVANWVTTYKGEHFDIIFADPPYHDPQFSTVEKLFGLLKPGGLMILSHPGRGEEPTKNGVVVVDNREYGNAFLTFYRHERQH